MKFHRPDLLDTSKHRRDTFDSGEPTLDDWLRRYAGQNRRRNTAAVWVIADDSARVACYATLSMTSVDRSKAPSTLAKGSPPLVPALLVGRLATDASASGLGLGTQMVSHLLATGAELNARAACRAVIVTALNAPAYTWWRRFGFEPFDDEDDANLDLHLVTGDIVATLNQL